MSIATRLAAAGAAVCLQQYQYSKPLIW